MTKAGQTIGFPKFLLLVLLPILVVAFVGVTGFAVATLLGVSFVGLVALAERLILPPTRRIKHDPRDVARSGAAR